MKFVKICALLISALLLAAMLTACGEKDDASAASDAPLRVDEGIEGIDFSNGNIGFLDMYYKPVDAEEGVRLELADFKDGKAAKITPLPASVPYVVIDAASLLGSRVTDARTIEIGIGVETPGGDFQAVSGEILVFKDWEQQDKKGAWSVYLDNRNPNIARMTLDEPLNTGEGNFFVLNRKVCNASIGGGAPSILYITRIGFLDESGAYLPVDENAVFVAPEGFNDLGKEFIIELPEITQGSGTNFHQGWTTDGTDGKETPYAYEDFQKAVTLVLELAEPVATKPNDDGEGGGEPIDIQIVWQGNGDDWVWRETRDVLIPLGETVIEFSLPSVLINYDAWTVSTQMKLLIGVNGGIGELGITRAYLIAYE